MSRPTSLLLDDVRRTVGLVDDDPHVFASTLFENVRLARPDASRRRSRPRCGPSGSWDWLDGLPDGLDTLLGDGHAHVSGGERARIGMARAVLADLPVLVLDEPTAHLDTATAEALAADLLDAGRGRSVVWVTHGTAGLDRVDTVLDLGRRAERGPTPPRTHPTARAWLAQRAEACRGVAAGRTVGSRGPGRPAATSPSPPVATWLGAGLTVRTARRRAPGLRPRRRPG